MKIFTNQNFYIDYYIIYTNIQKNFYKLYFKNKIDIKEEKFYDNYYRLLFIGGILFYYYIRFMGWIKIN